MQARRLAEIGDPEVRARLERLLHMDRLGEVALPTGEGRASRPEPPPPPDRIRGYRIGEELGRGGMGVVYAAEQLQPRRTVAIKLLNVPDDGEVYAARFQREAKILAALAHPNVVSCYQAGALPDGQCYLIMEFVDGPDLLKDLRDNGARSVEVVPSPKSHS